jgi:signal transduction histidine kinase
VVTEGSPKRQRFLGRTISLLLLAFLLGLLGVIAVDLYIEHRQVVGSTRVAALTIATGRRMGAYEAALMRYYEAVAGQPSDRLSLQQALIDARDRFAEALQQFDPYVAGADRATWQSLRERAVALGETVEGTGLADGSPVIGEDRIRALNADLAAIEAIVDKNGLVDLARAERLHTLHGALEAGVLLSMAGASLALLLLWRRQEARAHERDAALEDQLRRALRDLDGFAGRLAHDFRGPLQPILIGSQSIERAAVSDAVRLQAERIARAASRLSRMVDALLQFTRASAAGVFERQGASTTQVNAAVEAIAPELAEMARARGGQLTTDLGPAVTLGCASEVLESLVWNLVDNALKYGVKGGAPPKVTVRTRVEGALSVIEVEDGGPGIPPELHERVFEPFFRGQAAGEGIGLGLSIVGRVVAKLGGRVELRTGEEGGALFRILLPAKSAEAAPGRVTSIDIGAAPRAPA